MIRLVLVFIALTSFASTALATDACPPAGVTLFDDSEGYGEVNVPGIPTPLPFIACGPATIERGDPVFMTPPDPVCTIPTEIVSMTLTGVFDPCGMSPFANLPVSITLAPSPPSIGSIESDTGHFPARSFFDVFTIVDINGAMPPAPIPHMVTVTEDPLDAIPPGSATPGGPPCVMPGDDVYEAGFPAHEHNPCPPKFCCELPCGDKILMSQRACQRLHGVPNPGPCQPLCPENVPVEPSTWGEIKHTYQD